MFREKNEDNMDYDVVDSENTTIIRQDASFEGKMVFDGNVMVNGKFKGEIISAGELTVGSGGLVDGAVHIGTINIFGEVRGNIKAKQKIVINAPAVVKGDIEAPSLVIQEGAVFEGNCAMGKAKSQAEQEDQSYSSSNVSTENVIDMHNSTDN